MKRLLVAGLLSALIVPGVAAGAGAPRASEAFAPTAIGSVADGSLRLPMDLKGMPAGAGAGSLRITPGTDGRVIKGTLYDASGTVTVRFSSTYGTPAADGSRAVRGKGSVVTGSGAYAHARGTFTVSGDRAASGALTLTFAGTLRHDVTPVIVTSGRGQ